MLGGSFNPAHHGHVHISKQAHDALALDCVLWLVTPQNPMKDVSQTHNYKARLKGAKAWANHLEYIQVSEFEKEHGLTYTYDTVARMKELFPKQQFFWIMGSDCALHFHRWHRWQELVKLIPLVIVNRGHGLEELQSLEFSKCSEYVSIGASNDLQPGQWCYINSPMVGISSTMLRGNNGG